MFGMLYIVFTTGRCNLRCSYCGGSFPRHLVPWEVKYRVDELVDFIFQDPRPVVAFYGGEPLLNSVFMTEVMDKLDAVYVVQTNGLLMDRLDADYWRRFDTVLISIDGVEPVTDMHRGRGVYRRVLESARWLRDVGFKGDLVARMTVTEESDIWRDVTHLLSLGLFDHIHWQLNVVWSPRWRDFKGWLRSSYMPGLDRLRKLWVKNLLDGRVLGLAPFQGVLKRLFYGGLNPPCGAGVNSFAILTDGQILACPIAVDVPWARFGHIRNTHPERLIGKISIGEPCISCGILQACGGRCLYTHLERLWGMDGFREVCMATHHLVENVMMVKPIAERLIADSVVDEDVLLYPAYNNTVEIIP